MWLVSTCVVIQTVVSMKHVATIYRPASLANDTMICEHGCNVVFLGFHSTLRAGATSPVGQVSTGPLFSPSALTADLGDYDVRESIDERSTGSTELTIAA